MRPFLFRARVDIIGCQIRFEGGLDQTQIKRLAEIPERCPVHRTLTNETKIRTTLVGKQSAS